MGFLTSLCLAICLASTLVRTKVRKIKYLILPTLLYSQRDSHSSSNRPPAATKANGRRESRTSVLLSYLILALGMFTAVIGSRMILGAVSSVPIDDEWSFIHAIASAPNHQPPISWIWSQHNEHRMVFYRLLLLADIHFFNGRHWIEFWSMLLTQWASFGLLIWVVLLEHLDRSLTRATIGLGAFCLFCPTQWHNFAWGIQGSFLLPPLFLLVALLLLFKYQSHDGKYRHLYLGLSVAAAFASSWTMGNGVLVWPALVVSAALLGMRPRVLVLYTASGCALLGLYLYHYVSPSAHSNPIESLQHPILLVGWVASYMGVVLPPWLRIRNIVAESTGMIGIIGGLSLIATVSFVPRWRKPLPVAFVSLMLLSLGTDFISALGRLDLGPPFASRYQGYNLLFWLGVIGLCLIIADQVLPRLRTALLVGIPLIMLAATTQFPILVTAGRLFALRGEVGAVAPVTGVSDRSALLDLYPWDPGLVWENLPYLREQRLFMFSEPWAMQLNQPLAKFYDVESPGTCKGQITIERLSAQDLVAADAAEDLRVTGWAVSGPAGDPTERLLIVARGHIVGFGVGGIQLGNSGALGPTSPGSKTFLMQKKFVDWAGLARVGSGVQSIDVYAIDSHQPRHVCIIASAVAP